MYVDSLSLASLIFDVKLKYIMSSMSQVLSVKFQVSTKCFGWLLYLLEFYYIWSWKSTISSLRSLLYYLILEIC